MEERECVCEREIGQRESMWEREREKCKIYLSNVEMQLFIKTESARVGQSQESMLRLLLQRHLLDIPPANLTKTFAKRLADQ